MLHVTAFSLQLNGFIWYSMNTEIKTHLTVAGTNISHLFQRPLLSMATRKAFIILWNQETEKSNIYLFPLVVVHMKISNDK